MNREILAFTPTQRIEMTTHRNRYKKMKEDALGTQRIKGVDTREKGQIGGF